MIAPAAPPPRVNTPPGYPLSYEYPFLPYVLRQPLEVWVEEVLPGLNPEAGVGLLVLFKPKSCVVW